ncbi:uncharacterized protein LOC123722728 [Papilio machaon]|uniref:uncharacterized protein LOC123722728 n=1 Tax=Papilio machaon TaxID=76193 RepID=UPI001E663B67|nr:uncharacterized protein LOC123722728 [Papilio machaon]
MQNKSKANKQNSREGVNCRYHALQINLQRSQTATTELIIEAEKRKITFAIIQEPYVGRIGEIKQYKGVRVLQCARKTTDTVVKSVIIIFNDTINISQYPALTTENFAVTKLRTGAWEIGVVSAYLEGDKPLGPYLETIKHAIQGLGTKSVIVAGDVNAWNTWWGSRETNEIGEEIAAFLDQHELHILNTGTEPTFDTVRGDRRYTSCVDITTCSTTHLGRIDSCHLEKEMINSDHLAISFVLKLEKSKDSITNICEDIFRKIPKKKTMTLPWWTEELANEKKELLQKKRRISCAAPVRREGVVKEYLQAKEEYEKEITAQTISWKDFCTKQDGESM